MAKINVGQYNAGAEAPFVALAASMCLMICMIVSLLGIKIWWFKHRLTFDHSQTKNGAAGGSAPAVPPRQRSSKDKRAEQYRTSVEVHGVFRKRQDDEFVNVQPANQMPPRPPMNKFSQSTPALYPLPPTREPPRAPSPLQVEATVMPTTTTTTLAATQMDSSNNVVNVDSVQSTVSTKFEYAQSPPQPPKRYNRNLSTEAAKLKIANELQNRQMMMQRRPTGFSMSADDLQALEYVKEPPAIEVSIQQTQQLQQQISFDTKGNSSVEQQQQQQVAEKTQTLPVDLLSTEGDAAWQSVDLDEVESEYIYEEPITPTGSIKKTANKNVQIVEVVEEPKVVGIIKEMKTVELVEVPVLVPVFGESQKLEKEANTMEISEQPLLTDILSRSKLVEITQIPENVSESKVTRNVEIIQALEPTEISKPSTTVTIVKEVKIIDVIEEPKGKNKIIIKPPESMNIFEEPRVTVLETENNSMVLPPPRQVKFKNADYVESTIDDDKYTLGKIRRPTSFEGRNIELWDDLGLDKVSVKSPEERANQNVWLELQSDLNNDLMGNIEEEFNKIRHSYQENEGAFLETRDDLQPTGYGKSIDEDWASFENLEHVKQTTPELKSRQVHYEELRIIDGDGFKEMRRVSFDLPTYEESSEEIELSAVKTRRPTGFISDTSAMWRSELEESDPDEEDKLQSEARVRFDVEENEMNKNDEHSPLKERRPTGYTRNLEDIWDEKADMLESEVMGYKRTVHFDVEEKPSVYDYDEEQSPLKERRPTGYVHDYTFEEMESSKPHPEPMERKTKPRQKVTFDFNTEEHHYPAAYPTYNNSDYDDDDDDDDEEEEYDGKPAELPKPMQRMTNIRYTEQSFEPIVSITSSPILFSTQVSLDESTASDASDSWSAIRQHRYMTEELQQFSLHTEAPKPAYRNPLAQMAMQMQQAEQRNPNTTINAGYGTERSTEA